MSNMYFKKQDFEQMAILMHSIIEVSYGNEEEWATIEFYCKEGLTDIMLPSGRIGSPLALALETHNFFVALYMLQNKDKLGLSTLYVAKEKDSIHDEYDLEDEFNFSLEYFDEDMERKNLYLQEKVFGQEAYLEQLTRLNNDVDAIIEIDQYIKDNKSKVRK